MQLPKEFNIGGLEITVETGSELAAAKDVYGEFDTMKCRILIDGSLTPQHQRVTLVHELMHAIFFVSGASKQIVDMDTEEKILQAIDAHLTRFLQENDLSWLLKKVENANVQS